MNPVVLRNHWQVVITQALIGHAIRLLLLKPGETSYARLPEPCLKVIVPLVEQLLTDVTAHPETDVRAQRALTRIVNKRLWNALTPFSSAQVGRFQQLDFDPYESPESTREWCALIDREDPLDAAARAAAATQRRTHTG